MSFDFDALTPDDFGQIGPEEFNNIAGIPLNEFESDATLTGDEGNPAFSGFYPQGQAQGNVPNDFAFFPQDRPQGNNQNDHVMGNNAFAQSLLEDQEVQQLQPFNTTQGVQNYGQPQRSSQLPDAQPPALESGPLVDIPHPLTTTRLPAAYIPLDEGNMEFHPSIGYFIRARDKIDNFGYVVRAQALDPLSTSQPNRPSFSARANHASATAPRPRTPVIDTAKPFADMSEEDRWKETGAVKKESVIQKCVCNIRPERIKRPMNGFILFRTRHNKQMQGDLMASNRASGAMETSQEAGARWKALTAGEKQAYNDLAAAGKEDHTEAHPAYKYRPKSKYTYDFGNKECKCGAYEINMRQRELRRQGLATYPVQPGKKKPGRPRKRAKTNATPTASTADPQHVSSAVRSSFNDAVDALGLSDQQTPTVPEGHAPATAKAKGKRPVPASPPPLTNRRQTRSGGVNQRAAHYSGMFVDEGEDEDDDEDGIGNYDSDDYNQLLANLPYGAPMPYNYGMAGPEPYPASSQAPLAPPLAPVNTTRSSRSSRASQDSNTTVTPGRRTKRSLRH